MERKGLPAAAGPVRSPRRNSRQLRKPTLTGKRAEHRPSAARSTLLPQLPRPRNLRPHPPDHICIVRLPEDPPPPHERIRPRRLYLPDVLRLLAPFHLQPVLLVHCIDPT